MFGIAMPSSRPHLPEPHQAAGDVHVALSRAVLAANAFVGLLPLSQGESSSTFGEHIASWVFRSRRVGSHQGNLPNVELSRSSCLADKRRPRFSRHKRSDLTMSRPGNTPQRAQHHTAGQQRLQRQGQQQESGADRKKTKTLRSRMWKRQNKRMPHPAGPLSRFLRAESELQGESEDLALHDCGFFGRNVPTSDPIRIPPPGARSPHSGRPPTRLR